MTSLTIRASQMKEHGLFYDLVKFHTCMIGLEIVGVSVQPNNAPKNRNLKKKNTKIREGELRIIP